MKKPAIKPGLNKAAFLARNLLDRTTVKQIPTRFGFGEGLVEAGRNDPRVVALCADLTESTKVSDFKKAFPDRFIQMGIYEQAMAAIGAGLALAGKIPFIASYAAFSPGRNWEQIKTCACIQNANLKIAGAHAGVSVGPDGGTHQMLEDIILTRVLPNMNVIVPCDALESRKATVFAAKFVGPVFIRLAREKTPIMTTAKTPFKFGRAETYRFGDDVTVFAAGPILYEALVAAEALANKGIETRVVNMHTVKPLDRAAVVKAAKETGAIVTAEEAQAVGGLGGCVAEALGDTVPVPLERVGVQDRFGESGTPDECMEGFGLTAPYIAMAIERAFKRKHGEKVAPEPEYATAARENIERMKKDIWSEAITRAPKKWGGKKPDASLKSRRMPK